MYEEEDKELESLRNRDEDTINKTRNAFKEWYINFSKEHLVDPWELYMWGLAFNREKKDFIRLEKQRAEIKERCGYVE